VPRPWPFELVADADDVAAVTATAEAIVLDARPPARHRGEVEPIDARPGHIPGARNAPWDANLDPRTKRFLDPATLRDRYAALGITAGTPVVASCGSGVSACVDLLARARAGLGRGARLFPASWSGWAADPDRPAELG
jgi:thiosulfate/3-mercaptopyruvate sulfurtransferase